MTTATGVAGCVWEWLEGKTEERAAKVVASSLRGAQCGDSATVNRTERKATAKLSKTVVFLKRLRTGATVYFQVERSIVIELLVKSALLQHTLDIQCIYLRDVAGKGSAHCMCTGVASIRAGRKRCRRVGYLW